MMMVISTLLPGAMPTGIAIGGHQTGFLLPELQTIATQIDVTADGTPLRLDWPRVSGATEVALTSARITLLPPTGAGAGLDLGDLRGAFSGERCTVTVPDGPRPVRALRLAGLRLEDADATPLPRKSALTGAPTPVRLAIAVKLGGVLAPVGYAVPHIGPSPSQPPYVTPPLLAGASYADNVLTLPDVMAEELQIMVVTGSDPEDFAPVSFALDGVSGRAALSPQDVSLLDGTGAAFYSGAGPITAATTVDAKNAVQRALEAAIKDGAQPSITLKVTGRTEGKLGTFGIVASGEVRRVFDDKIAVTLEGGAVTPAIPGAPLDPQTPFSATADVVVEHAGLRLHDLSDPVPAAAGGQFGQVLTMEAPLWRPLPPMAMRGEVLRRIGLVGFGLTPATLGLRVLAAGPGGAMIAPPDLATGTCEIAAPVLTTPQKPQVFWCDLGEGVEIDRAIGIEVTARTGRFLWIANGDRPLLRFAVTHDLVGGETVRIGSHALAITAPRTTLNAQALTPAVFTSPPVIDSTHFLTLTLSRLTLGYAP